jgi:hypothetical protein
MALYEAGRRLDYSFRRRNSWPAEMVDSLANEEVPMRRDQLTFQQIELAKKLYRDGQSLRAASRALRLPVRVVRAALLGAG